MFYGKKVWNIFLTNKSKINHTICREFDIVHKFYSDITMNSSFVCVSIIGVHKKCTNEKI